MLTKLFSKLSSKTGLMLFCFITTTFLLDFVIGGILSTMLANDTLKLGEAKLNTTTGITTFEKSVTLNFSYYLAIMSGLLNIGFGAGFVFVANKEGKLKTSMIILIGSLMLLYGGYNLIAGILKVVIENPTLNPTAVEYTTWFTNWLADNNFASTDASNTAVKQLAENAWFGEKLANAEWENWMTLVLGGITGSAALVATGYTLKAEE